MRALLPLVSPAAADAEAAFGLKEGSVNAAGFSCGGGLTQRF